MNKIEIIREIFPNLSKIMLYQGSKAHRAPNKHKQTGSEKKNSHPAKLKTLNVQNKDKILKAAKERDQATYEGWPVRININNKHDLGESRETILFTMS